MTKGFKECFDVTVIGAGLSGLTSAALLSKAGLRVCVLEQNAQAGGYLAVFKKNGFVFDTSIHWLNHCNDKGIVNKIFSLIGNDYPRAKPMMRIKRYVGENFDYLLTSKPDDLRDRLIEDYPDEKESFEKFFSAAKNIHTHLNRFDKIIQTSETMPFHKKIFYHYNRLLFALPYMKYVRFTGENGKKRGLNSLFKAKFLHKLFSNEPDLISCLIPISWAYNNDYQIPPQGGSHSFINWLEKKVLDQGGKIIYQAEATKIVVKNKSCSSVIYRCKNENREVFSKQVIAASDLSALYNKLIPKEHVKEKTLKKIDQAEIYNSAFIVYIALNCKAEELGISDEIIQFSKKCNKPADDKHTPSADKMVVFSPSARDHSLTPEEHGSLIMMIPASFSSNNRWNTTTDEQGNIIRGEAYRELKKNLSEKLIDKFENEFNVTVREKIVFYDSATPVTLWRYTQNRAGSMMGIKPGKKNILSGVARYKTPIKGLYLCGHWAELGGGVPIAAKSALNASLLVLKSIKTKTCKQYRDYIESTIS